jgi:molecular chaperone HtpG
VFVTDSVEQIVPEFLTLLQGVIDSPDIPLNVSRSYLQGDPNVKKISQHIVKKVADKLLEIYNNDRPSFEEKWESLGLFVKYGMLSDDKFYNTAQKFCLYKNTDNKSYTFDELKERTQALQKDKNGKLVLLYSTDAETQHTYIHNAQKYGYEVLLLDSYIDQHFIQFLEGKHTDLAFKRVDADTLNKLIEKDEEAASLLTKEEEEKLKELFTGVVETKHAQIELKPLAPEEVPVQITKSEFMRRMSDMSRMGGGQFAFMGEMPEQINVVVNTNHTSVKKLLSDNNTGHARQLYDLALLAQGMLKGKALTEFIHRSVGELSK